MTQAMTEIPICGRTFPVVNDRLNLTDLWMFLRKSESDTTPAQWLDTERAIGLMGVLAKRTGKVDFTETDSKGDVWAHLHLGLAYASHLMPLFFLEMMAVWDKQQPPGAKEALVRHYMEHEKQKGSPS